MTIVALAATSGLLLLALLWISTGGASLWSPSTASPTTAPRSFGPTASWSAVLAVARREAAARLERGSVVTIINANEMDCRPPFGKPSEIEFLYVQPSGKSATIVVTDTDPPSVTSVDPDYGGLKPMPPAELQRVRPILSGVNVGPREVCEKTWQEGRNYATVPRATLWIAQEQRPELGVAPVWEVVYLDMRKNDKYSVAVSSQTGDIMERNLNFTVVTPSPGR
jgi:hypothetical protein